jgi:hypothetical protein
MVTVKLKIMKQTLAFIALSFITYGAIAQDSTGKRQDSGMSKSSTTTRKSMPMKDGLLMKDGKMMQTKQGKQTSLDKEMTLQNGTVITTDGIIRMKDGSTKTLQEGQSIDMNGKLSTLPGKPKKTTNKNNL